MMKHIWILGLALAGLALSAVAATSASAADLDCYLVSNFVAKTQAGNWSEAGCKNTKEALKFRYVLALPVFFIEKNLWCAEILNFAENKTGSWKTKECSKAGGKETNGPFIEVQVEGLPTFLAAGKEPSATDIIKFGGGSKKAVLT